MFFLLIIEQEHDGIAVVTRFKDLDILVVFEFDLFTFARFLSGSAGCIRSSLFTDLIGQKS